MGHLLYYGLYALQHRGQESCGMAVFDGELLHLQRGLGLVSQVFTQNQQLAQWQGKVGLGHTRYSTAGGVSIENAQPVVCRSPLGDLALAHNGNLFNLASLRQSFNLELSDAHGADSDSHVLARCLAQALTQTQGNLAKAAQQVLGLAQGAFSLVVTTQDRMVAARDRYGLRPLCLGQLPQGGWVVSSETCALDIIGATYVRDLDPGEVWVARLDGSTDSLRLPPLTPLAEAMAINPSEPASRPCVFEYIYFARPDSQLAGRNVYATRMAMGQRLAKAYPVEADWVIPVPDSGTPAAVGYAQASGIPYLEGLIKNRYVGRTFIQPTQGLRERGLRLKLNPLSHLLQGKRVVVVDDSIVRGNTSQRLVHLLREAGVSEVHLRISSPPVKHPCFYGIDMSDEAELIANHYDDAAAIADWLGCDSLGYLSHADLLSAVGLTSDTACMACFTGDYPAGRPLGKASAFVAGCCG
jgi:amidophosphoribosyltransferase